MRKFPAKYAILSALTIGLATLFALGVLASGCATDPATEPADSTATTSAGSGVEASGGTTSSETTQVQARVEQGEADGLFDATSVHEISISFSEEDYAAMIEAYKQSEDKEWIEAEVTIDGDTYERAGIRLKGNSSLRGLANGRGMGTGGTLSAESPEGLPWLVRLDKYVDGQNHEGVYEFVVRSNNSETALNEAVALDLLEAAGLASQDAVAVSLSVNGSAAVLRLVTEHPDDAWMAENLDVGGALYKAESTGDYSYRGEDPDLYDEVFDQEAGKDNTDLTPLIDFLEFINTSDDAAFKAELGDRLDIDAFVTYLAMQELIANFDDIDGPGNNSYLYYDPEEGTFTVVPWDHNLAFGAMNRGGGGGGMPGGQNPAEGGQAAPQDAGAVPGGQRVPPGQDEPAQGMARPQRDVGQGAEGQPRTMMGRGNILVQRFKADAEFEGMYTARLAELREALYESGLADDLLAQRVSLLKAQASNLVDPATVDLEAARIAAYFSA